MIGPAVLFGLATAVDPGAQTLKDPYWTRLTARPSETDLGCAGYDHLHQWAVAVRDGEPHLTIQRLARHEDPLPFAVPKHRNRSGDRHVLRVANGWIVGFDNGEFGGGLWFTATGADWDHLHPPADAPASRDDPFKAENVRGLAVVNGQPLVLMGLDHLIGRSGRVFSLVGSAGAWSLSGGAVLDSSPHAWRVVGEHIEVVTEDGLWVVREDGTAELIAPVAFGMAYPASFDVASDGRRIIGMRRYVLLLQAAGSRWMETWYGPRTCPHSRRNERWECSCTK